MNGTNRAFQSFTDNAIGEILIREQLRVIVRMRLRQLILPVIQEHVERQVAVTRNLDLVSLRPDLDTNQCDENIKRSVQLLLIERVD